MFQFISIFLHYLIQVLVRSTMNQCSLYIVLVFLEYFSSSIQIAISLVLIFVLVIKIALVMIVTGNVLQLWPSYELQLFCLTILTYTYE